MTRITAHLARFPIVRCCANLGFDVSRKIATKIGTKSPRPAYLDAIWMHCSRTAGVGHVLQSMWSSSGRTASLPEMRRANRHRRRCDGSGCWDGTAFRFQGRPASAHARHSMDGLRRLFSPPLAAGATVSSHGIGRWYLDARIRCVDDRAVPSKRLAFAFDRHRCICARHSIAGRGHSLADAPVMGPHLRHRHCCAHVDQAVFRHDPGDLYPLGPARTICGPELRPTLRRASRVPARCPSAASNLMQCNRPRRPSAST